MHLFRWRRKANNTAVSHVVGFILTFVVITSAMASIVYTTSVLVNTRVDNSVHIIARHIANYVADSITEALAIKQMYQNVNYSSTVEIPQEINGKSYYIEVANGKVFVNTSDGVSENTTLYNQEKLDVGINEGRVYGDNGVLKIWCNRTDYVAKLDFGVNESSTSEISVSPGAFRFTRFAPSCSDIYDNNGDVWWDDNYKNWSYRMPIRITNTNETISLTNYQVKVELKNSNFNYLWANKNGSDIRITAGLDDGLQPLPYWIERWSYGGNSVIWFKADSLPAGTTKTFYLYFGNPHAVSESNGSRVFDFFDDFKSSSLNSSKWYTYGSDIEVQNDCLIIGNGSAVVAKNVMFTDGIFEAKAKALSTGGDTEASLFIRASSKDNPYNTGYFLSSGKFSGDEWWKNFSIGEYGDWKVVELIAENKTFSMTENSWYRLSFYARVDSYLYCKRQLYTQPQTSQDISVPDTVTIDKLSGYFGVHTTKSGCRAKYDWVLYRQLRPVNLEMYLDAPVSQHYAWSHDDFSKLHFTTDYTSGDDPLFSDAVFSPETANFSVDVDNGVYSVVIYFGSPTSNVDNASVYAEGEKVVSNVQALPGHVEIRWFTVEVDDSSLDIRFENENPGALSIWSMYGLTVERGVRGIRISGGV